MSAPLKSVPPVALVEVPQPQADAPSSAGARGAWLRRRLAAYPRWAVYLGAGVVLVLAAVTAARLLAPKHIAVAPAPVQTITVGSVVQAPMGRTLTVNGSLAAWDELPIAAEAGGLAITQVAVEEGDTVTKGQLLAKLDDSVLGAELAQAHAAVAQAEAGLVKAQAMAVSAASDVKRAKELSKNGYISGQVTEQRETTFAASQADVNVARQNLATAKAMENERAAQLTQTEIRAPTDGIVSKRTATIGNVVSIGEQLFRLIRDSRVELRAEVPEMDLSRLQAGQPATIIVNDAGSRHFDGKIRLVGATVDPQTRIGMVYIALPNDPALKPGMFVHGEIKTGEADVLQVPAQAIVYKDFKPAVFIVDADNRAKLRMVETGTRMNGQVEIVSGLSAGERVALAGAGYLKDNDFVRVEAPLAPTASDTAGGVVR